MAQLLNMFMFAGGSLATLFTEMSPIVYVLFILGTLFVCIEIFLPGFGFFGISGIVLLVASFITRAAQGGNFVMVLFMFLIAVVVIGICVLIMVILMRSGKLKSAIFNVESSLPTGRTDATQDFSRLIGQVAVTENFLRPVGQAKFDNGEIVDVVARNGFVDAGLKVVVVSVEGQLVKVDQIKKN